MSKLQNSTNNEIFNLIRIKQFINLVFYMLVVIQSVHLNGSKWEIFQTEFNITVQNNFIVTCLKNYKSQYISLIGANMKHLRNDANMRHV